MNCPSCKSTSIKLEVFERNYGYSYFDDDDCTDSANFECVESWITKRSSFICYDCTLEDEIKFLEGKLPYPVKDRWGKAQVKLVRKDWHKAGKNKWKHLQSNTKQSKSSATESTSTPSSMAV